mmetsp:Transcript_29997/g.82376  ORF Transcript_29997/g.82376 Transcript_29997/m.82376 type:complete len:218 (+) Transcript_29997:685-1338(+)
MLPRDDAVAVQEVKVRVRLHRLIEPLDAAVRVLRLLRVHERPRQEVAHARGKRERLTDLVRLRQARHEFAGDWIVREGLVRAAEGAARQLIRQEDLGGRALDGVPLGLGECPRLELPDHRREGGEVLVESRAAREPDNDQLTDVVDAAHQRLALVGRRVNVEYGIEHRGGRARRGAGGLHDRVLAIVTGPNGVLVGGHVRFVPRGRRGGRPDDLTIH